MVLNKNNKKNSKKILRIILIVSLIVFIVSASIIIRNKIVSKRTQAEINEMSKQLEEMQKKAEEDRRKAEEEKKDQEENGENTEDEDPGLVIDLSSILAINSDVIGWITVEGTNISYPLLYAGNDNSYYLTHNYKGEYDSDGSIFIENYNSRDLSDFNTLIYGHSMLSGTMFRHIHDFADYNFFMNNSTITIYMADCTYTYTIFASEVVSSAHILTIMDNYSVDSCQNYVNSIYSNPYALIRPGYYGVNAYNGDHIITLSTCTGNDDTRMVIHAVRN